MLYDIYLFLLGQLLVQSIKRCKDVKKIWYGVLIALVGILLIFNPGVAIAFNGFAYAQTRYTFVLMPIAALLVAVEWDRLMIKRVQLHRAATWIGSQHVCSD